MVTGANYLLETEQRKILIECGLFQGSRKEEKKNYESFPYNPAEIESVLITHAHLDHIGRLPKLIADGFKGDIYATGPTIDFARVMLEDSQKILHEKASKAGVIPLMDNHQIERIMKHFKIVEYDQAIQINPEMKICFKEAGHVLGSAIIEMYAQDKKIVFSGDLGSGRMPILRNPVKIQDADYVLVESAYGDRIHESVQATKDQVEDVVEETACRGGVLMIPSFALERTQQLLYHFNELVENNRIPRVPIFLDSPLAIKLTRIYARYPQYYNKQASLLLKSDDDIFKFPGLKLTETTAQSKQINQVHPPKIIIAGSGMSVGGRIIHHETRYLSDPKNTLLIVTYQVKGTTGRKILEGAKQVKILDQNIKINAQIKHVNGYSAHADQSELIDWLKGFISSKSIKRPKNIFTVQGDKEAAGVLAQKIRDNLGLSARMPKLGEVIEL